MGKIEPVLYRRTVKGKIAGKKKTAAKRKPKTNPKKALMEPGIHRKTAPKKKTATKRKAVSKGAEFKKRSAAATRKKNAAKGKLKTVVKKKPSKPRSYPGNEWKTTSSSISEAAKKGRITRRKNAKK